LKAALRQSVGGNRNVHQFPAKKQTRKGKKSA